MMHRLESAFLPPAATCLAWTMLAMIALGGCSGVRALADEQVTAQRSTSAERTATPFDRPRSGPQMLFAKLNITVVEVPVGASSGSEEIWSYLDEEPLSATGYLTLSRNGFRVGLARADAWPDIARILARLAGRQLQQTAIVGQIGDPMSIILKKNQPVQTIFIFFHDQTLSGADYPPGDNLLTFSCSLNLDDSSTMVITGLPQIRSSGRKLRYVQQDGSVNMLTQPDVVSLEAIMFQLSMSAKDIIVIGPGSESRRTNSVARHFLVRQNEGVSFETVLVIVPEVVTGTSVSPAGPEAHVKE